MIKYDLSEEEIKIIEKLRKKAKVNEKKLKKKLEDFVKVSDKLTKIVTEIYDTLETNYESKEIIEQTIDTKYLRKIYYLLTNEDAEIGLCLNDFKGVEI